MAADNLPLTSPSGLRWKAAIHNRARSSATRGSRVTDSVFAVRYDGPPTAGHLGGFMKTRRDILQKVTAAAAISLVSRSVLAAATENGKTWYAAPRPHFERLTALWAVKRFVDKDAKFVFVAKPEGIPANAIAIGFKDFGELSTFDDKGTVFHKTCVKYKLLDDPAIAVLDKIVAQGRTWVANQTPIDMNDRYTRWAYGLLGVSDSMTGAAVRKGTSDQEILDRGFPIYDLLFDQISFELKKS